jgi:hypothetical protein
LNRGKPNDEFDLSGISLSRRTHCAIIGPGSQSTTGRWLEVNF